MNEPQNQPPLSQNDIEGSANVPQQPNQTPPDTQSGTYAQSPQPLPPQPGSENGYPPQGLTSSSPQPYYLQSTMGNPGAKTPKRLPKGRLPLLVLGGVIVMALVIGVIVMFVLANTKKAPSKQADNADSKQTDYEEKPAKTTALDTISYLRNYFKGESTAKTSLTTPVRTGERSYYTVITDPKIVETTSIAGTMSFDQVAENLVSLKRALDFYGYKETIINENQDNVNFLADYIRDDVKCQLYAEKPADMNSPHYLEAKCIDSEEYEKLAVKQEPFFRAYTEASALGTPLVILGSARITDSASAGYELAEVSTGALVEGRFVDDGPVIKYYSGPDNIWRFFTSKSEVQPCEVYYRSPSLTSAYLNTPCLNSRKQQVNVTLKRNNG